MKRMITLSVLLFIFICSMISSAQVRRPEISNWILEVPQGFVLESLCGYGFNNATINTVSNISSTNPANMLDYTRFSIGISYQVESKIKESWFRDIQHYRKNLVFPQSFSLILPFNKIRVGLGFNQKYNSEKDYGEITVTVVDTSNQAGYLNIGTIQVIKTCLLFDHSLSLGYTFNNFLSDNDNLDLGLKISFYRLFYELNSDEKIIVPEYQKNDYSLDDKHSYDELGFAVGMKYQLENLQIALAYEKGTDFYKEGKGFYLIGKLPNKWSSGILLNLSCRTRIAGGLNYLIWDNPISDFSSGTKNQIESYGSIIYQFFHGLTFSTGYFHTNYRYRGSSDLLTDRFNAWYFTAGFLYSLKFVDVDLALADSHLFSGEWRKQTIIKIGLGYRIK